MIQFALLFGFGFLSATLLVMILAPAVHRRVVRYTENRLKATMPISPAEVRAQRDMARAVYAAENARTKQELLQERDKAVDLQIRFDKLVRESSELHSSNHELQMQVQDMSTEAAELRSRLRREEGFIRQLKESLAAVEHASAAKDEAREALERRMARLISELDDAKLDLSARETEIQNARLRATALREERDTLRMDVKLLTARAKDAELRLHETERKLQRLEAKLEKEVAAKADLLSRLDWREQELERLRFSRADSADLVQPVTGNYPLPRKKPASAKPAARSTLHAITDLNQSMMQASSELETRIQHQASALSTAILEAESAEAQETVRGELAALAADMVALTALKDGDAASVKAALSAKLSETDHSRESLAARAVEAIDALAVTTSARQLPASKL
ncbi:hypothetical protein ACFSE1_09580 [Rhizobium helianthi]|uniref:Uncharacterized protein n=1 Tax=Rhizobium helianthi TaxID=1132695 RepID=A0ABW4M420_9HYPH